MNVTRLSLSPTIRGLAAGLATAIALAAAAGAAAAPVNVPPLPTGIPAPEGHVPFLIAHAVGTQNQVCMPNLNGVGMSWFFYGPQATLFNNKGEQVATHFLSVNPIEAGSPKQATWQHSRDTSAVWAVAVGASVDPEFVDPTAIPWLLLEVKGAQDGPGGGDRLSGTTYIQRINTSGGRVAVGECSSQNAKLMVPYEADYVFYHADQD